MSKNSKPNEPRIERLTILRLLEAATNRLASGESLVKSPTLAGFAALSAFVGALDALPVALAKGLAAALAALLGARGVTAEGAFGKPLAGDFLAGPGRFNLVL